MWPKGAKRALAALAIAFALAGCGGDDEPSETSGATGAQGPTGAATDITADEFLLKLLPEKEIAIEAVVATEATCEGVKVQPAFVLVISDAASQADPDAPLAEIVEAEC